MHPSRAHPTAGARYPATASSRPTTWPLRALLVAALASGACFAAATAPPVAETPETDANVLRVGSDMSYPPYDFVRDGQPGGFDIEFMTALARSLDLRVRFIDTRFDRLIPDLRAGRFDVIASTLYVKPERERLVDFVPYLRTGVSFAVRHGGQSQPREPEDLCGRRVGTIKGAAWIEKLRALNEAACYARQIVIVEYPASPDATQALADGRVDVQIEDSAVLLAAIGHAGGRLTISSNENFYPVVAGLGVRKDDEVARERLHRGLRRLQGNGCYDDLLRKYGVSRPQLVEFYLPVRDEALIQARRRQGKAACDP